MHMLSFAHPGPTRSNIHAEQFRACVFISAKGGQNVFHALDAALLKRKGGYVCLCRSREEFTPSGQVGVGRGVKLFYIWKTFEVSN